ncbi:hypothetical protein ACFP1I_12590 [Dyadobacter subterraneus]|uniref:Conjugative transposon TraJ C-terminal domain-containing protein n=1 Tax=Dyadobacter subterraneus TaxID=2773304 RepID=A0ABR9W997_9BACT|nr:hypothetical protein [Dyadobacter subterraneus]MBE9462068.1 hypothetical protein [Dyadobacter subterraneus]
MVRRRVLSLLLIIGIVGYFSVPSVAGYIIQAGGQNTLLHKVTTLFANTALSVGNYAFPAAGGFGRLPAAPDKTSVK